MSMTKEEAIKHLLHDWIINLGCDFAIKPGRLDDFLAALDVALSALHPVTREQVEKVGKRCKRCAATKDEAFNPGVAHNFSVFDDAIYYCDSDYGWEGESILFCPWCGMPLTDKAVDMVIERLEALKDGKND